MKFGVSTPRFPHGLMTPATVLVALGLAAPLSAAKAEPVTYKGSIGNAPIVVELSADPKSLKSLSGRYFYQSNGIDIPLRFEARANGSLNLSEDAPCAPLDCSSPPAMPGAFWVLRAGADDETLTGSWASGEKTLPISLKLLGRPRPGTGSTDTPAELFSASEALAQSDDPIGEVEHPYEYAKLDIPVKPTRKVDFGAAAVQYVVDPRTKFEFPRIAHLPGGASATRANALLKQLHWRRNIAALNCAALRYAGFRESASGMSGETGTLGGYDEITVDVKQLSGKLMSWVESGSLWCAGGSPDNFSTTSILDVEHGRLLSMGELFQNWSEGAPSAKLVSLVRTKRPKPSNRSDIAREKECRTDELIKTNLSAYFVGSAGSEPRVTFGLTNLPTVVAACGGDLVTLPLSEVRSTLTPLAQRLLR